MTLGFIVRNLTNFVVAIAFLAGLTVVGRRDTPNFSEITNTKGNINIQYSDGVNPSVAAKICGTLGNNCLFGDEVENLWCVLEDDGVGARLWVPMKTREQSDDSKLAFQLMARLISDNCLEGEPMEITLCKQYGETDHRLQSTPPLGTLYHLDQDAIYFGSAFDDDERARIKNQLYESGHLVGNGVVAQIDQQDGVNLFRVYANRESIANITEDEFESAAQSARENLFGGLATRFEYSAGYGHPIERSVRDLPSSDSDTL